jgi:hypothetical protein
VQEAVAQWPFPAPGTPSLVGFLEAGDRRPPPPGTASSRSRQTIGAR